MKSLLRPQEGGLLGSLWLVLDASPLLCSSVLHQRNSYFACLQNITLDVPTDCMSICQRPRRQHMLAFFIAASSACLFCMRLSRVIKDTPCLPNSDGDHVGTHSKNFITLCSSLCSRFLKGFAARSLGAIHLHLVHRLGGYVNAPQTQQGCI